MTAMLWSPNTGVGYPYSYPKTSNTFPKFNDEDPKRLANFQRMDTNNDNKIDENDDAYLPYFPGDEYVDWVGLSIYNTFATKANGNDESQTENVNISFIKKALDGDSTTSPKNFYDRFAKTFHKPFIISETAAPLILTSKTPTSDLNLSIKQNWFDLLFNLNQTYPLLRAVVWFEELKFENDFNNPGKKVWKDYRVTDDSRVREEFLESFVGTVGAGALEMKCDGHLSV
jgi:hypothetical protein